MIFTAMVKVFPADSKNQSFYAVKNRDNFRSQTDWGSSWKQFTPPAGTLQHAGFNHNFSNVIYKVISYPIEMIFTPLASIFLTDFKYVSLIAALHRDHMLRPFKHASR